MRIRPTRIRRNTDPGEWRWKDVGEMSGEQLMLEVVEASLTLGGAGERGLEGEWRRLATSLLDHIDVCLQLGGLHLE